MKSYQCKSVTISRKPGQEDGSWSAFIGLFEENNPHLKAKVPTKVLEFKNIEKVRIKELRNVSYYLMGSDVIVNDLKELRLEVKKGILLLTGKQELPKI